MNDNTYKLRQLRAMLEKETDERTGGYGAHLTHWAGGSKPVNLDAEALQALIEHYERKGSRDTLTIKLHTYDLQRIVIALIEHAVENRKTHPEITEECDRLTDIVGDWNKLVSEANDWTVDITVRG